MRTETLCLISGALFSLLYEKDPAVEYLMIASVKLKISTLLQELLKSGILNLAVETGPIGVVGVKVSGTTPAGAGL
jgi:hypothetical protein